MPQLAPTFSEVFDYQAYEENTVDESTVEVEKPDGPSFDVMDFPLDLPLDLPLHDVQNVASQDGALMQGPLRILHRLFHTDDQEIARTPSAVPLRRETTELMLDLSLPTAGPSRTASQQRLARELERMTSDFGSEFDGSDAVIYGGTERSEGSFSYQDSPMPRNLRTRKPFSVASRRALKMVIQTRLRATRRWRRCDELSLAEDLPHDFPTPVPLGGDSSPSHRSDDPRIP